MRRRIGRSALRYSVEMNTVERDGFIIQLYSKEQVSDAWTVCGMFISEACRRGPCEFTPLELRDHCEAGDRALWSVRQVGKGIVGAAITTIVQEPNRRILVWTAVGGRRWDSWSHFEEVIAATAKVNGCEAIRGYCRRGWKKKLKSYREIGVILERQL